MRPANKNKTANTGRGQALRHVGQLAGALSGRKSKAAPLNEADVFYWLDVGGGGGAGSSSRWPTRVAPGVFLSLAFRIPAAQSDLGRARAR